MCYHDEPPYDDLPKAKPPTKIVVAGQTVDVVPWPPLPETPLTDHPAEWRYLPPKATTVGDEPVRQPSRLERIAAAFGWRW